jgi:hypothetical protein
VRTVGYDRANNLRIAKELTQKIAAIPGLADVHLQQEVNTPELFAQIDRARATQFGLTANSIALNLNTSLSSSEQVSPNFWTDPANGTPYYLAVLQSQRSPRPVAIRCLDCSATSPPSSGIQSKPMPIRPTSNRSTRFRCLRRACREQDGAPRPHLIPRRNDPTHNLLSAWRPWLSFTMTNQPFKASAWLTVPVVISHIVYASPGTTATYRNDGKFPDSTVLVKEVHQELHFPLN